jgi:hypothetical protein
MTKMDRASIAYVAGALVPRRFPISMARLRREACVVDQLREMVDEYAARVQKALARAYRKQAASPPQPEQAP